MAKPFLKWVGGKTQLLNELETSFSDRIKRRYVEPFVGGGAVLFWMLENHPEVEEFIINDKNADLINVYNIVKNDVEALIEILKLYESEYYSLLEKETEKKKYYYLKRDEFNEKKSSAIEQAALFIFLNRTCFNGMYRVNKKNEFNIPIGSYKRPSICNVVSLKEASVALENVSIYNKDYKELRDIIDENTLVYFDPPYKPLNKTSNFVAYTKSDFNDEDQIKLAEFCKSLDSKWVLSNSDVNAFGDSFFDDLYKEFEIQRVFARRNINSNGKKRGKIPELLIRN